MTTTIDPLAILADRLDPPASPYTADPVAWVKGRMGGFAWSKQREIMESVRDHKRTAVHSAHDLGKSHIAAQIGAWWIDSHPVGEAFVASTAPTYTQVHSILWEEIRKAHRRGSLPGRVTLSDVWKIGDEEVGYGRKPADTDAHGFQGIHRRYVLAIIDEACGVPEQLYNAVEAITTNADCRILAIGNPDAPDTKFAQVCDPLSGWNVIHLDGLESPNFTDEYVPDWLRGLLLDPEWVEDKKRAWGEDSAIYRSKVRGLFTTDATSGVVPSSWIARCRLVPDDVSGESAPNELGVDPAAGGDESVIAHRKGAVARILARGRERDTMAFADQVEQAILQTGATRVKVDAIGVGKGVADRLRQRRGVHGAQVIEVNVGRPAANPKRFARLRDELWWEVARELSETGGWILDIPDDAAAQLAAPRWTDDASGRIVVESKDALLKRGIASPDCADALILAFTQSREPRTKPRDQTRDRSRGRPATAGMEGRTW